MPWILRISASDIWAGVWSIIPIMSHSHSVGNHNTEFDSEIVDIHKCDQRSTILSVVVSSCLYIRGSPAFGPNSQLAFGQDNMRHVVGTIHVGFHVRQQLAKSVKGDT